MRRTNPIPLECHEQGSSITSSKFSCAVCKCRFWKGMGLVGRHSFAWEARFPQRVGAGFDNNIGLEIEVLGLLIDWSVRHQDFEMKCTV